MEIKLIIPDDGLQQLFALSKPEQPELKPETENSQMLTTEQLAKYLNCSILTIRRWCKIGKLEFVKIGHRALFAKDKIDRLIAENSLQKGKHTNC